MIGAILAILDSRSFGSIWFWLLLALVWTLAGRRVVGVPADVIARARRTGAAEGEDPDALRLLDWLSLTLPRWRMGRVEGAVALGVAAFVLTALFVLGFLYGLEMAQALVLLLLPLLLLAVAELRLARRLAPVVEAAARGEIPANAAAAGAARLMGRQRRLVVLASILVVALTAWRGALWFVAHPFGF